MGCRENSLVGQSVSRPKNQVGKETGQLRSFAAYQFCPNSASFCRGFRIGSKLYLAILCTYLRSVLRQHISKPVQSRSPLLPAPLKAFSSTLIFLTRDSWNSTTPVFDELICIDIDVGTVVVNKSNPIRKLKNAVTACKCALQARF